MSDLPFGNIFGDSIEDTGGATAALSDLDHASKNINPSLLAGSSAPQNIAPPTVQGFGDHNKVQNFTANINMLEGFGVEGSSTSQGFGAVGSSTSQGFGAPKPDQTLDSIGDIGKDEEFKVEAIFGDFTPIGIGAIKRIVPIGEWLLDDPAVKALKRNLDEMGVTQAMPMVYANRLKHNIEKGYVQPDGSGFTEKGQQRAAEYLQYRYNQSSEEAMKRAGEARSVKIDTKRGDKAKGLNLKFGFGYQLDTVGRAVRH